jgi:hypothetical protein
LQQKARSKKKATSLRQAAGARSKKYRLLAEKKAFNRLFLFHVSGFSLCFPA